MKDHDVEGSDYIDQKTGRPLLKTHPSVGGAREWSNGARSVSGCCFQHPGTARPLAEEL